MYNRSGIPQSSATLHAAQEINQLAAAGIPFLFVFDFEMQKPIVCRLSDAANRGIYYNFCGNSNGSPSSISDTCEQPLIVSSSLSQIKARYDHTFERVQSHLNRGDAYLINLTQKIPIMCSQTLAQVFNLARAPYRLLLQDRCVVFSPEPFVTITGRHISTFPMKGTIAANQENAEQQLISDPKEAAEHVTVVDLLRNDLSMVASEVRVDRYQYVEKIETLGGGLLQASSKISGMLPEDFRESLGDILCTLLPAGSVSGAPKLEAVKIIANVEGEARGYYTGVCGLYDGRDLVSTVLIRFIETIDDQYYFRSGGGITFQSDREREYQELLSKVMLPVMTENLNQFVNEELNGVV